MATETERRLLLIVAIVAVCVAWGCGDSPTGPSTNTNRQTATVPGHNQVFLPVEVLKSGTLAVTLTWTDGNKNLSLSLSGSNCASCCVIIVTQPGTCGALVMSDLPSGTREEVTRAAQKGETFKAWVSNRSDGAESITVVATVR